MAIINVDDAYILNETGEQVDKTTGIPFKDESLTEAEAAQARENIRAGGTNPNLLDNPWFTVRQRGDGPFSGANTEAFDRWRATNNSILTGTANGITITTTVRTWGMQQRVAKGFFTVGKTYTISAMEQDGTITSATFTWTGSGISKYVTGANVGFEISVSNGNYEQIYFTTNYVGSVDLKAVKLELGSVSTLANDAPPDYGTEFLKCARYFLRIKYTNNRYPRIGTGVTLSTSNAAILIPTPVPMRATTITVSYSGSFAVISVGSSGNLVSAMSYVDHTAAGVGINCTLSDSVFTPFYGCMLQGQGSTDGYIDLSADL